MLIMLQTQYKKQIYHVAIHLQYDVFQSTTT
jgi:hypothetical protein